MPFGLTNAPNTYQRLLYIVLTKFKSKYCFVYIDDMIIFSKSDEEQIYLVRELPTTLPEAGVTLAMNKSTFFSFKVEYLGHGICLPKKYKN